MAMTDTEAQSYFKAVHDALPLDDPNRHMLESPAVEDAFARMAAAYDDGDTPAGEA